MSEVKNQQKLFGSGYIKAEIYESIKNVELHKATYLVYSNLFRLINFYFFPLHITTNFSLNFLSQKHF